METINLPDKAERKEMDIAKLKDDIDTEVEIYEEEYKGEDRTFIKIPISSDLFDRDEDDFSEQGLETMKQQAGSGIVPFVPDHGDSPRNAGQYSFVDVLGKFVKGSIENQNNKKIVYADLLLDEDDWLAQELKRKLEKDMPIGFSVGFIIKDSEENDQGGQTIHDIDLLEVSAVGIPSNPATVAEIAENVRASASIAAKGIIKNEKERNRFQSKILKELEERFGVKQDYNWSLSNVPTPDDTQISGWEPPDMEDFEDESDFFSIHKLERVEDPDDVDQVALPLENSNFTMYYDGLVAAARFAPQVEGISDQTVEDVRDSLEGYRQEYFEDQDPLLETEESINSSIDPEEYNSLKEAMEAYIKEVRIYMVKEKFKDENGDIKIDRKQFSDDYEFVLAMYSLYEEAEDEIDDQSVADFINFVDQFGDDNAISIIEDIAEEYINQDDVEADDPEEAYVQEFIEFVKNNQGQGGDEEQETQNQEQGDDSKQFEDVDEDEYVAGFIASMYDGMDVSDFMEWVNDQDYSFNFDEQELAAGLSDVHGDVTPGEILNAFEELADTEEDSIDSEELRSLIKELLEEHRKELKEFIEDKAIKTEETVDPEDGDNDNNDGNGKHGSAEPKGMISISKDELNPEKGSDGEKSDLEKLKHRYEAKF